MVDPSATPDRPIVVVIVEDEVLLRELGVEALRDAGFVTFEADNAVAALEICKSRAEAIDVLFTDIRMPGPLDGLELAHRVRQRWPWIGVIVASGNIFVARDELPENTCFMPKPYDMDRVVEQIWRLRELR